MFQLSALSSDVELVITHFIDQIESEHLRFIPGLVVDPILKSSLSRFSGLWRACLLELQFVYVGRLELCHLHTYIFVKCFLECLKRRRYRGTVLSLNIEADR